MICQIALPCPHGVYIPPVATVVAAPFFTFLRLAPALLHPRLYQAVILPLRFMIYFPRRPFFSAEFANGATVSLKHGESLQAKRRDFRWVRVRESMRLKGTQYYARRTRFLYPLLHPGDAPPTSTCPRFHCPCALHIATCHTLLQTLTALLLCIVYLTDTDAGPAG